MIHHTTIAFSELACLYFPNQHKRNAVRCLSRWIDRNTALKNELIEEDYKPYLHQLLTPLQHDLITTHLGEPTESETELRVGKH